MGLSDGELLCFLLDQTIDADKAKLTLDANDNLFATVDSEDPPVLVETKHAIIKIRRPIRIKELLQMVILYVKDHSPVAKKTMAAEEVIQSFQESEPQSYSLKILVAEDDMTSRQVHYRDNQDKLSYSCW